MPKLKLSLMNLYEKTARWKENLVEIKLDSQIPFYIMPLHNGSNDLMQQLTLKLQSSYCASFN